MYRWLFRIFPGLESLIRRELVADVPVESYHCLDCGKVECSEGEYQDCASRKMRAREVAAALERESLLSSPSGRGAWRGGERPPDMTAGGTLRVSGDQIP